MISAYVWREESVAESALHMEWSHFTKYKWINKSKERFISKLVGDFWKVASAFCLPPADLIWTPGETQAKVGSPCKYRCPHIFCLVGPNYRLHMISDLTSLMWAEGSKPYSVFSRDILGFVTESWEIYLSWNVITIIS